MGFFLGLVAVCRINHGSTSYSLNSWHLVNQKKSSLVSIENMRKKSNKQRISAVFYMPKIWRMPENGQEFFTFE